MGHQAVPIVYGWIGLGISLGVLALFITAFILSGD